MVRTLDNCNPPPARPHERGASTSEAASPGRGRCRSWGSAGRPEKQGQTGGLLVLLPLFPCLYTLAPCGLFGEASLFKREAMHPPRLGEEPREHVQHRTSPEVGPEQSPRTKLYNPQTLERVAG